MLGISFEERAYAEATNSAAPAELSETSRTQEQRGGVPLSRAIRSNNLWLCVTYVGLIMLMARTYA